MECVHAAQCRQDTVGCELLPEAVLQHSVQEQGYEAGGEVCLDGLVVLQIDGPGFHLRLHDAE